MEQLGGAVESQLARSSALFSLSKSTAHAGFDTFSFLLFSVYISSARYMLMCRLLGPGVGSFGQIRHMMRTGTWFWFWTTQCKDIVRFDYFDRYCGLWEFGYVFFSLFSLFWRSYNRIRAVASVRFRDLARYILDGEERKWNLIKHDTQVRHGWWRCVQSHWFVWKCVAVLGDCRGFTLWWSQIIRLCCFKDFFFKNMKQKSIFQKNLLKTLIYPTKARLEFPFHTKPKPKNCQSYAARGWVMAPLRFRSRRRLKNDWWNVDRFLVLTCSHAPLGTLPKENNTPLSKMCVYSATLSKASQTLTFLLWEWCGSWGW